MPSINKIRELTEPVEIQRGPIKFTLQAALERISASNDEYEALRQAERTTEFERNQVAAEMRLYTDNPEWLLQRLSAPVKEKKGERLPSEKEVEERTQEVTQHLESLQVKAKELYTQKLHNICARIVYLVPSWDITQEGSEEMLPITVENLLEYFSEPLLNEMLTRIEGAVFGPLAILGDSMS